MNNAASDRTRAARRLTTPAFFALLFACSGGNGGGYDQAQSRTSPAQGASTPSAPTPPPISTPATTGSTDGPSFVMLASSWEIGPVIGGRDYSVGMPLNPMQTSDGWAFDFPLSGGVVGYVTFPFGSLAGKSHIVIHYRVDADPSVQFFPVCCPQLASMGPTLYFQERGDDWNTDGMRWWATFNSPTPIRAGDYTMDVPLDGAWTSVFKMSAANNPAQFEMAKLNADRVGFTFGGGDGYGHGVYANGSARFVLLSFKVE